MGHVAISACSDLDEAQESTTPGKDVHATKDSILEKKSEEPSKPVVARSVKNKKKCNQPDGQRQRAQSTKTRSTRETAITVLNESNPFRMEENKALYEAFERRSDRTKSWVAKNQNEKVPKTEHEQNPFDRMTKKILHEAYERRKGRLKSLTAGYNETRNVTNPFRKVSRSSRAFGKTNRSEQVETRGSMVTKDSNDWDDINPFRVVQNPNSPNYPSLSNLQNPNNPRSREFLGNSVGPRRESDDSLEFLDKEQPEDADFNDESNRFDWMLQSSKNEVKESPVTTEKTSRFDNLLQSPKEVKPFSVKCNVSEPSSSGDSLLNKSGKNIFGEDIFASKTKSRNVMDIFDIEKDNKGKDTFRADSQEKPDDHLESLGMKIGCKSPNPPEKYRNIFKDLTNENQEFSRALPNDAGSSRTKNPSDLYNTNESSTSIITNPEIMFDSWAENEKIDIEKTSTNCYNSVRSNNRGIHATGNQSSNSNLFGETRRLKSSKNEGIFKEKSNNTFFSSSDMDSESEELLFAKKAVKQPSTFRNDDSDSEKKVADWLLSDF